MKEITDALAKGSVIIYPTDTIYGIGCDATNEKAVSIIRELKQRDAKPFSVIVPSVEWIRQHCIVTKAAEEWIAKLPGPYTLVLKLRHDACVAPSVSKGTIGVRIPAHWISKDVAEFGKPVVTTSVNVTGQQYARRISEIDISMLENADLVVDEGVLAGKPSTVVDCTSDIAAVRPRA